MAAEEDPESLIVLGGGAVGAELAQVLARFGAQVTVLEAADRLLPADQPEAGELLAAVFAREQITVRTAARAGQVSHDGRSFTVRLAGGDAVSGQQLLVATGRRADLAALGIGAYGLDEAVATIPNGEWMRIADGLWAIVRVLRLLQAYVRPRVP